jgi:hypothetical protein
MREPRVRLECSGAGFGGDRDSECDDARRQGFPAPAALRPAASELLAFNNDHLHHYYWPMEFGARK